MTIATVATHAEARQIARKYAHENDVNECRAEALAEMWFDAGKDFDLSSPADLCSHLRQRFTEA